ncbi:MAG: hypothetical protein AAF805_07245 [Planctomycetota bacterium]
MSDPHREAINKRLTLNLLIQGAAEQTHLTAHHLVREELAAIDPQLLDRYDRLAVVFSLNSWRGDATLFAGRPSVFWGRVRRTSHPFHRHALLASHGRDLAFASKRYLLDRANQKGVSTGLTRYYPEALRLYVGTTMKEAGLRPRLDRVARLLIHRLWGIERDRLDGAITDGVANEFSRRYPPATTLQGRLIRMAVAGYSCVERRDGRLVVIARATLWTLLVHELSKGVAELICLRGMNDWQDDSYAAALDTADRLEQETWLMQAGAELWRLLLRAIPRGVTPAVALARIAELPADRLERLMIAVATRDTDAGRSVAALIDAGSDP